jgi:hypothetical protein
VHGQAAGESRLGLSRHVEVEKHRNLTTNAAREPKSSRSVRPLHAQISKRDSPGPSGRSTRHSRGNWQVATSRQHREACRLSGRSDRPRSRKEPLQPDCHRRRISQVQNFTGAAFGVDAYGPLRTLAQ